MTYNASGNEFLAHPAAAGTQFFETILALPGCRFAVEYVDNGNLSTAALKARIFDGAAGGSEIPLNVGGTQAVLRDGRIVAVQSNGNLSAITAQFLDANFAATGDTLSLVTDPTSGFFRLLSPVVQAAGDGGFAMAFGALQSGTSESRILLQLFDASGTRLLPNARTVGMGDINGTSSLATLSDGRIAVLNPYGRTVSVYAADLTGTPQVTMIDTDALAGSGMADAKIVALQDGAFVVVWAEAGFSPGAIHARIFDAAGAMVGEDIVVSPDGSPRFSSLDVAALASGDFAVAWAKSEPVLSPTGTIADIAVKTFSATGAEIGFEKIVNTTRAGDQYIARIVGLTNGDFVVGWLDASQSPFPGSGTDVRAQIFTSNAGQVVNGTAGADTLNGTAGDDTLAGLAGNDTLNGSDGTDTASYVAAETGVAINLARTTAQNTIGAGRDTLVSIENLDGSGFADALRGDLHSNVLTGGDGDDRLFGADGIDRLVGGSGADRLVGGTGADTMIGGTGNDVYFVDHQGDQVIESSASDPATGMLTGGTDKVIASVDYTLPMFVEILVLAQGAGAIDGSGNGYSNTIIGNESDNFLWGGGSGADRLTGGLGADTFKFNFAGGPGTLLITDFQPGIDHLVIGSNPFFAFYGREGQTLTEADLAFGPRATTPDQHLVYYARTGTLYYDPDGVGGEVQTKLAVFLGRPDLDASDIGVIVI